MVNRNWKRWIVCAPYSSRCQKELKRVLDVLIHSEPWSLFIVAIVKQNIFTWLKELTDTPNECGTTNMFYYSPSQHWVLIAISFKRTPNKGKGFGHISQSEHKYHIHIHTQTSKYIQIGLMKAINYEILRYVLFTSSLLPSLSQVQ